MAKAYSFPWRKDWSEWTRWRQWKPWGVVATMLRAFVLPLRDITPTTPIRCEGSVSQPGGQPASSQASGHTEIERLFMRYQAPLLDYLFGMTHDRELAADLLQETFVRALSANQPLGAIEHPQAWLYRIATNAALNASRRQRRFRWLSLGRMEPSSTANSSDRWQAPQANELPSHLYEDFAVSVAERDAVWRTLIELPPRWRAVLLMQTTAGFSTREIATSLGLEEGNVRKILFRAKERFRALYTQLERQDATAPPNRQGGQG